MICVWTCSIIVPWLGCTSDKNHSTVFKPMFAWGVAFSFRGKVFTFGTDLTVHEKWTTRAMNAGWKYFLSEPVRGIGINEKKIRVFEDQNDSWSSYYLQSISAISKRWLEGLTHRRWPKALSNEPKKHIRIIFKTSKIASPDAIRILETLLYHCLFTLVSLEENICKTETPSSYSVTKVKRLAWNNTLGSFQLRESWIKY